ISVIGVIGIVGRVGVRCLADDGVEVFVIVAVSQVIAVVVFQREVIFQRDALIPRQRSLRDAAGIHAAGIIAKQGYLVALGQHVAALLDGHTDLGISQIRAGRIGQRQHDITVGRTSRQDEVVFLERPDIFGGKPRAVHFQYVAAAGAV